MESPIQNDPRQTVPPIVSFRTLVTVWIALLMLLGATVIVANVGFGRFSIHIALAIALLKVGLVALYFMGLRHDKLHYSLAFLLALAFMFLLLNAVVTDSNNYQFRIFGSPAAQGDKNPFPEMSPSRTAPSDH